MYGLPEPARSLEPICYDPEGVRTILPIEIRLVADDGREAGAWQPHFMIYVPYLRAADIGISGPTSSVFVAREGEPLAHVITVAPEFVDPETGGGG